MDLTPTIVPKSDQLNADDLMAGPRTVTVVEVTKGTAEQPVNVVLKEYGPKRPYKPSKSMRRVMVAAWGVDTSTYAGRTLTLYRDPHVRFGGEEVGGIRISAMSDIPEPLTVSLTVTRGKRAPTVIQPLGSRVESDVPDEVADDWVSAIGSTGSLGELQDLWRDAASQGVTRHLRIVAAKDERKKQLSETERAHE